MFTGIVEAACPVLEARDGGGARRLRLDLAALAALDREAAAADGPGTAPPAALARLGDSVAVDGVCLTVAALDGTAAAFDVVPETLSRTTLGALAAGGRVNVERALRFGDRVDGHLVQGHVEGTGTVRGREELPGELRLTVGCGGAFARRCLPKGSVTVQGVSLTVAALGEDTFTVALVPHTLERTTLGDLESGDAVNLEADMIGQWVLRAVEQTR